MKSIKRFFESETGGTVAGYFACAAGFVIVTHVTCRLIDAGLNALSSN